MRFWRCQTLKKARRRSLDVLVPVTRGNVILGYKRGQTDLRLR